jgi:hypothetical protein
MVFDDSFTTTKSLQTDKIPENWPALFKHSEVNLLDPDQEPNHKLDASWQEPSVPTAPTASRNFSKVRFIDELDHRASTTEPLDDLSASPPIDPSNEETDIYSSSLPSSPTIDNDNEHEFLPSNLPSLPSSCLRQST